jgi:hypothetical protein
MAGGSIGRLFYSIEGDKSKLDKSLEDAKESLKALGLEASRAGMNAIAAFDQALNPTKRLADQFKLLESAGKSAADIQKVFNDQILRAGDAALKMGQALDPVAAKYYESASSARKLAGEQAVLAEAARKAEEESRKQAEALQQTITAFQNSLNPTRELGAEIAKLEAAGQSFNDIYKVYSEQVLKAGDATLKMGQELAGATKPYYDAANGARQKLEADRAMAEEAERLAAETRKEAEAINATVNAFNRALNPTEKLGSEIRQLQTAGKSSTDIWKVYEREILQAAEAQKRMGTAIDPTVKQLMEQNSALQSNSSMFSAISSRIGTVQKAFIGMGLAIGTAQIVRGIANIGKASIDMATNAVESENLFGVAMGKMADETAKWSKDISSSLGLNEFEIRKNVGTFNVVLNSMGVGAEKAAEMSKALTNLAYDFSSFYNLHPDEAFDKIRAGISGEMEPLKRLGILLDETSVKNYAYSNGIAESSKQLTQQEKVLARYGLLLQQTAAAQGDLARTLDSPANQLRLLQTRFDAIQTSLGMAFLPTLTSASGVLSDTAVSVNGLNTGLQDLARGVSVPLAGFYEFMRTLAEVRQDFYAFQLEFQNWLKENVQGIPGLGKVLVRPDIDDTIKKTRENLREAYQDSVKWGDRIQNLIKNIEAVGKFNYAAAKAAQDLARVTPESDQDKDGQKKYKETIKDLQELAEWQQKVTDQFRWGDPKVFDATIRQLKEMTEFQEKIGDNFRYGDPSIFQGTLDYLNYWTEAQQKAGDELRRLGEESKQAAEKQREAYGEIFDAMVSRGKGAFTELGDWIEGVFLTRLKVLFQNLVEGVMNGFKGGFGGILNGVIPGIGGKSVLGGLSGISGGLAAGIPGASLMAALSGNSYAKGLGITGLGITGIVGASTLAMGGGMSLFGTMMTSAFTNPITAAIAGSVVGGIALAKAAVGKNSQTAGAMEVSRDLGLPYGKDAFKDFYQSLGLSESSSYGIRHDLIMSPKFLVEQALPIAEQTGRMAELLSGLEKFGFRDAFELGKVTGDWSDLNEQFRAAFENSSKLWKSLPDWESALMAPAENASTEIQKLMDSLLGVRNAIEQSITPTQNMYEKFLATGEIAAEFARQIEAVGGSLAEFQELADLNLQMSGLQESLSFITQLQSSLKSLAPQLDPIQQILSGSMGAEALAALAQAGLDPSRFSGLSGMIGMQQSFSGFQPFQSLTPELRQALSQYGGSEGQRAIEQYAAGINTITADLLASTKAAMDQAYTGAIKDAMAYLEAAQKETADKMEELINAVDDVKTGVVDVLNRILVALDNGSLRPNNSAPSAMEQYAQQYAAWKAEGERIRTQGSSLHYAIWKQSNPEPKPPQLAEGGYVERTGWAVVHEGEEYSGVGKRFSSGPVIQINGPIYGFNDFVERVREAGLVLQQGAPAWA